MASSSNVYRRVYRFNEFLLKCCLKRMIPSRGTTKGEDLAWGWLGWWSCFHFSFSTFSELCFIKSYTRGWRLKSCSKEERTRNPKFSCCRQDPFLLICVFHYRTLDLMGTLVMNCSHKSNSNIINRTASSKSSESREWAAAIVNVCCYFLIRVEKFFSSTNSDVQTSDVSSYVV